MLIIVRNHDLQKRIAAVFIESMLMEIIGQILSAIPGFAPAGRSKPAHKLVQARTINNEKMFDKNLECFRNRLKPDNRDPEEMKSCGRSLRIQFILIGLVVRVQQKRSNSHLIIQPPTL